MSVTDYISSHEKGEKLNDTLIHKVTEAYVALGRKMTDAEGLVDAEKLKEEAFRREGSQELYQILEQFAIAHYGAATQDADRKESLVFSLFGMNLQTILKYFDQNQEKSDFSGFFTYAQRETPFGYFLRQNSTERPKSKLKPSDAEEAARYTGTEGKVDTKKLTVDHIAELVEEFIKSGLITPQFLKGKDYAIDNTAGATNPGPARTL